MKYTLIAFCLFFVQVSLSPSQAVNTVAKKEIQAIEIEMQGDILVAISDNATDPLTKLEVYTIAGLKVADNTCSTVKCTLNLSSLPRGTYLAVATSKRTQYSESIFVP